MDLKIRRGGKNCKRLYLEKPNIENLRIASRKIDKTTQCFDLRPLKFIYFSQNDFLKIFLTSAGGKISLKLGNFILQYLYVHLFCKVFCEEEVTQCLYLPQHRYVF